MIFILVPLPEPEVKIGSVDKFLLQHAIFFMLQLLHIEDEERGTRTQN
jgi:hypothetical protein